MSQRGGRGVGDTTRALSIVMVIGTLTAQAKAQETPTEDVVPAETQEAAPAELPPAELPPAEPPAQVVMRADAVAQPDGVTLTVRPAGGVPGLALYRLVSERRNPSSRRRGSRSR